MRGVLAPVIGDGNLTSCPSNQVRYRRRGAPIFSGVPQCNPWSREIAQ